MFLCGSEDIIPHKFHKYSGVKDYEFRVSPKQFNQNANIEEGWFCNVKLSEWESVYLPYEHFPNQIEALAILSKLDGETERPGRYINVHMAYESVVKERNVEYSSIRHALAHPITKLTRPTVKNSLLNRFGGLSIDLTDYYHQKEFYRCIGQMLIETEKAVYEYIIQNISIIKIATI